MSTFYQRNIIKIKWCDYLFCHWTRYFCHRTRDYHYYRKMTSPIKSFSYSNIDLNLYYINIYNTPWTRGGGGFWSRIATLLYSNPNLAQFGTFKRRKFRIYLNWWELMSHKIGGLTLTHFQRWLPILLGEVKSFFYHHVGNSVIKTLSNFLPIFIKMSEIFFFQHVQKLIRMPVTTGCVLTWARPYSSRPWQVSLCLHYFRAIIYFSLYRFLWTTSTPPFNGWIPWL